MGLISFFKRAFGKKKETVVVVETENTTVTVQEVPETKTEAIPVIEPVKEIGERLAEVAEKKEECKAKAKRVRKPRSKKPAGEVQAPVEAKAETKEGEIKKKPRRRRKPKSDDNSQQQ